MSIVSGAAVVEELRPAPSPARWFDRMACLPHCLFLDSAPECPEFLDAGLGRYSFLAAEPFAFLALPPGPDDVLGRLIPWLRRYQTETIDGLPPFQGGAAGLFAYDLNRSLERVPAPRWDEFRLPALAVGLYDVVLAFDHAEGRAWIVSQGFPETEPAARRRRAAGRLEHFLRRLRQDTPPQHPPDPAANRPPEARGQRLERLSPQFPAGGIERLTSNFAKPDYLRAVRRAIESIRAGDVFQVNLAQRLLYPAVETPPALYRRLRRRHPAPFAGYFDLGGAQVVSASPERFLCVAEGRVETRPIKGTRHRPSSEADQRRAADVLRRSAKDRAENVMIVDLLRNDLSRVCRPESVRVSELCRVEAYAHVLHLVSAVEGALSAGRTPVDLLRAAFPGGSITGAPKVRAMEIIAELEPTARGAYCGSLGYVGFDGSMDLSILIRTVTAAGGWWQLPVGGGIVAQSDPDQEYEETWHKAEGLLRALEPPPPDAEE